MDPTKDKEQAKRASRRIRCAFLLGQGGGGDRGGIPKIFPSTDRQIRALLKIRNPKIMAAVWKECTEAGQVAPQDVHDKAHLMLTDGVPSGELPCAPPGVPHDGDPKKMSLQRLHTTAAILGDMNQTYATVSEYGGEHERALLDILEKVQVIAGSTLAQGLRYLRRKVYPF